jgi:hypothetical protein
MVTPFYGCS